MPHPDWQLLSGNSHPHPERPYAVIRHDPLASRFLGQWRWDVFLGGWGIWRSGSNGRPGTGLRTGRTRDETTARNRAEAALAHVVKVRDQMAAERAAAPRPVSLWVQR